jgi:hypothetical protein
VFVPDDPLPTTRERVRILAEAGLSGAAIAREIGVTRPTVAYHLRRLGFTPDERFNVRYDWGAVQAFHDEGHSARACMDHFGMSGKTWHDARLRGVLRTRPARMPIEEVLSRTRSRRQVKRRLIEAGLKPAHCEICELADWRGAKLSLELHHINGDPHDHSLENLQILCPNCHSQTPTWGGRKRTNRSEKDLGLSD